MSCTRTLDHHASRMSRNTSAKHPRRLITWSCSWYKMHNSCTRTKHADPAMSLWRAITSPRLAPLKLAALYPLFQILLWWSKLDLFPLCSWFWPVVAWISSLLLHPKRRFPSLTNFSCIIISIHLRVFKPFGLSFNLPFPKRRRVEGKARKIPCLAECINVSNVPCLRKTPDSTWQFEQSADMCIAKSWMSFREGWKLLQVTAVPYCTILKISNGLLWGTKGIQLL